MLKARSQGVTEIAAVLFDADGVVQQPCEFLNAIEASRGWEDAQINAFWADLFAMERSFLTVEEDFAVALAPLMENHGLGISAEHFLAAWCRQGIAPDLAALDLVSRLRGQGVVCALATNQMQYRARFMLEELCYAEMFDPLFVSCRMGIAKPSVEFFEAAIATIGLEPSRLLFIDDHGVNVEAAVSAGLHAAVLAPGEDLGGLLSSFGLEVG